MKKDKHIFRKIPTKLQRSWTVVCAGAILWFLIPGAQPAYAQNQIQTLIDQAVADGQSSVTIPPGTYRSSSTLHLRDLKDFTIIADGVTMIQEDLRQHVSINNCSNLHLQGITLDHDPLPFTQATITSHAEDWSWLEAEIDAGYPLDTAPNSKVEVYDGDTGLLVPNVWTIFGTRIIRPSDTTIRLTGVEGWNRRVEIGDKIVVEQPTLIPHGVSINQSQNCTFENITLHTSTSFGFFETACHGNAYLGIQITPGPSPVPGGEPRMRSLNADGIHSKHATLGPRIEDCLIESMGDDGIAINGDYDLILDVSNNEIVVAAKRDLNMQVGDLVRAAGRDGAILFESIVTNITPVTGYDQQRDDLLDALNLARAIYHDTYRITVGEVAAAEPGSVIGAANRKGNGLIVRKNTIRNKRARGILIKAEDGIIEENTIEDNHMGAIVLTPELFWMEAGFSRSVQIRNNTIRRSGLNPTHWMSSQAGIIAVSVEAPNGFGPPGGHLDIEISGNRIEDSLGAQILATSISGLTIRDNVIIRTHTESRDHGAGRGVNPQAGVVIINCDNVTLARNTVHEFGGSTYVSTDNVSSITGEDTFSAHTGGQPNPY